MIGVRQSWRLSVVFPGQILLRDWYAVLVVGVLPVAATLPSENSPSPFLAAGRVLGSREIAGKEVIV
jgi:hypothetical protein